MSPKPIEPTDEIRGLKACMNDLMGILALPTIWSGREQEHVISTLLDAVGRVLKLDFVYAQLKNPDGKRFEMIRIADTENANINSDRLRQALKKWLRNDPEMRPSVLDGPEENSEFGLAAFCLGVDERVGVFVAGSARSGFPNKSDRLLLNVAVNEAVVALREAQLLNEHRRVARELDLDATRQKEKLEITSRELKKENERRKAVEKALRLVDARHSNAAQATAVEETKNSEMAELRLKYARLTPREREVLPFVVAGRLSKQTAAELGTSEITIRVHRGQIMRKMQAHSLAELIRMADALGIMPVM
jgi:DNA-binding CsgD family transcriptional regulator